MQTITAYRSQDELVELVYPVESFAVARTNCITRELSTFRG